MPAVYHPLVTCDYTDDAVVSCWSIRLTGNSYLYVLMYMNIGNVLACDLARHLSWSNGGLNIVMQILTPKQILITEIITILTTTKENIKCY